jgi:hypothetical protein
VKEYRNVTVRLQVEDGEEHLPIDDQAETARVIMRAWFWNGAWLMPPSVDVVSGADGRPQRPIRLRVPLDERADGEPA